jgi:AraC family transcriptional regulator
MMNPRIEILPAKKLVGKRVKMSFANNKVIELWQGFMPRRKEINNNLNADLISMQVYDSSFDITHFNPLVEFDKWAAVEVECFDAVPSGMETFYLQGGLYAVFDYKGRSTDNQVFKDIFGLWLPSSGYQLDNRPHFEILGSKYRNNDPESEEEIWIPVRLDRN